MRRWPRTQRAIADVIREVCEESGLTARQLSAALGESHNYVSQLQSGTRECSLAEFIAIARKLKRRPGALVDQVERRLR